MRFKKSFSLALNILFHSKLRSWLTIIGIVIGMGAVVAILSISAGAEQQLKESLGSLGADVLTISLGGGRATGMGFGGGEGGPPGASTSSTSTAAKNLTAKDLVPLKTISNIEYVMGSVSGKADITYSTKTVKDKSIEGVDLLVWKEITTSTLSSGRYLTQGDVYSAVVGSSFASSTFSKAISLNDKITIAGKSFNVVGILNSGNSVYIPISVARDLLEDAGRDAFSSISVKIYNVSQANDTVNEITKKLMMERGILQESKVDFRVSNPAEMQATIQETMSSMTLILGAIAAISLIVGAIGIANTMFTSVLEKTNDIGTMKAIGAKNKDILSIFLLNSGLIGLIGGLGGVVIGVISSSALSAAAGITGTTSSTRGMGGGGMMSSMLGSSVVSPSLIIGVLSFSILVGMIAGIIPAIRASKLSPVDALRYE
jgi:putative ABC transport system permease protein